MNTQTKKKSIFGKFLNGVELLGNRLPDPFMLFAVLAVIVILLSYHSEFIWHFCCPSREW